MQIGPQPIQNGLTDFPTPKVEPRDAGKGLDTSGLLDENATDASGFYGKPDVPLMRGKADMPPPEPTKPAYSDGVMIGVGAVIVIAVAVIAVLAWRARR